MSKEQLVWAKAPEKRDYEAAAAFLSLVFRTARANALVRAMRRKPITQRSAKEDDLKKISKGKPLAPVLLVCGDMSKGVPLLVADGYHRICAVCHYDEFAPIACQMAEI
jgi:hypothetical protein